jgi:hypothetical protein
MTHPSKFHALTALSLACAVLAGCGGGDAEAPPPQGSNTPGPAPAPTGPDTTPPTVIIADNTSAVTAGGPVTFTFVFSEDVGTSFGADDIVVTGGTFVADRDFIRVSGRQATLVVTPTANATGTIDVSVAAQRFTDIQGNGNSATAAAQQAYSTVVTAPPPPPPAPAPSGTIFTFDETTAPKLTDFGVNTQVPELVTDPAGGTNKVLKVYKVPGSEQWAGVTVSNGANDSIPAIPFTASAQTMTLRVYSPAVGVRVRLKVENATNNGISVETDALTTTSGAWETLTFNFANPGTNPPVGGGATASLNLAQTYNKVSIFSDFGLGNGGVGALPGNRVYYYDDLRFVAAGAPPPPPPPPPSGGTAIFTFDETTAPKLTDFGVNTQPPEIVVDPAGGTNKVLKFYKVPGSEQWAGVTISNGANDSIPAIPFTASAQTMTLRVYSPAVGVRVRLKVENATNNGISVETDALTTTSGAWETLTFNFANPGTNPPVGGGATASLNLAQTYNKVSVFSDFGLGNGGVGALPGNRVYYYDDLTFVAASAPPPPPPPPSGGSAIVTFDESTAPVLADFGVNGQPPEIVTDPAGGTNKVLKFYKVTGSEQWAGVTVSNGPNNSIPAIPFTASAKTMTVRVYSPAVGVRVRLKVENAADAGVSVETDAISTTSGAWETLTFNFANPGTAPPVGGGPTAALNLAQTYNKVSIFSDFGLGAGGYGPLPAARVYYYDDIRFQP